MALYIIFILSLFSAITSINAYAKKKDRFLILGLADNKKLDFIKNFDIIETVPADGMGLSAV